MERYLLVQLCGRRSYPGARRGERYGQAPKRFIHVLTPQFRQAVHDFAQKEIAPRATEIDKTNRMPEVSVYDCERALPFP
jgi:hypothetical protein